MQRKLQINSDQFRSLRGSTVRSAIPGSALHLTEDVQRMRDTSFHDAFVFLWQGTSGRLFTVQAEQEQKDGQLFVKCSIVPLPNQHFDSAFLLILARAFPNKDIQCTPHRELWVVPSVDFDEMRTRLVRVSNALSLVSWVQDPVVRGCTELAANIRTHHQPNTPLPARLPDAFFTGSHVNAALGYVKTYSPILEVLGDITQV